VDRELARKLTAEALGTGLLVAAVVGSGIAAQRLSPGNTGLQLLENSTATARSRRVALAPFAVAGYLAAAYWFTSSTSFANPAVTIARMLSNTFAGIEPSSVPAFVVAQLVGGAVAIAVAWFLYADLPADAVVVPHDDAA
jgi:glycerol uptake facilitator-like aquaporin